VLEKNVLIYYLVYKALMVLPTLFCASFIVTNLTYRAIYNSFKCTSSTAYTRRWFNVSDASQRLCCQNDIDYVLKLFNKSQNETEGNQQSDMSKLSRFFRRYVYKWEPTFKFSSRFVSSQVVALITLYHVFIFFIYQFGVVAMRLDGLIPNDVDLEYINIGSIVCGILGKTICVEGLENVIDFRVKTPQVLKEFGEGIKASLVNLLVIPVFLALLVCIVQYLLSIKECREHIMQVNRGKCIYITQRKNLSNGKIAAGSFHFGGFLTVSSPKFIVLLFIRIIPSYYFKGYLVWGFLILMFSFIIIGLLVIFVRYFVGLEIFLRILRLLVPALVAFILKYIIELLFSRIVFLHRGSKILAIDNFQSFNIFLYFNFFFDCFIGVISAIIRIIKTIAAAIIMMPRIGYSFLGRKLEDYDNGKTIYWK
jgi:hypothetical protein